MRTPRSRTAPALENRRRHPSSCSSRIHRRLRYPHAVPGRASQDGSDLAEGGSRQPRIRTGTTRHLDRVRPTGEFKHRHPLPCSSGTSSTSTLATRGIGPVLRQAGPHRLGIASEHSEPSWDGGGLCVQERPTMEFTHNHSSTSTVSTRGVGPALRTVCTSRPWVSVEAQWAHGGTVTDLEFEYGPCWTSRTATSSTCSSEGSSVRRPFDATS